MKKINRGFTLIEILIAIGIIAVLAAIVLVAINPARQFAQANNTQRISNVNAILNAIGQRLADNKGTFEGTFTIDGTVYTCGPLPTASTTITITMAANVTSATGDLGCLTPTFLPLFPTDPKNPAAPSTGYSVIKDSQGRVKVFAEQAELGSTIAVVR
ncbi:prepilin-type N-terminal cleavage/methylation domain-containing protein [Candidatus Parcubacteria bacterium]|nr:prepilin-type N-terminal cleavage/methylation domain-containing protein [Candidatus Parcubacteria bacterium]